MNTLEEMRTVIYATIAGKVIQYEGFTGWKDCVWENDDVRFNFSNVKYRVKPEPKLDVVGWLHVTPTWVASEQPNCKFTFDGETGELKSAEVLKP